MQLLQQFEAVQHDNPAALDNLLREGQVHESASRYPLAREIYLIAARQEHIKSAYSLALLYLNSYIPMNQHEMLHYLTKASEQYYRAQYNLARIYERGEFVTKDISRAIVLYQAVVNNPQSMPDLITGARKKVESLSVLVSTDNTRVLQNLTLKK
jgi:TPR repeat protein